MFFFVIDSILARKTFEEDAMAWQIHFVAILAGCKTTSFQLKYLHVLIKK